MGLGGDVCGTKMPSAMQVLPTLWPHAAHLWIGVPVWGTVRPQGSSLNFVAAGETHGQLVGLY